MPCEEPMPKAWGKERLAPLVPVWSHPLSGVSTVQVQSVRGGWGTYWTAAATEHIMTVRYNARGWRHLWSVSLRMASFSSSSSSSSCSKLEGSREMRAPL